MRAFPLSYCNILSPVWLLSLTGLLISETEIGVNTSGEKWMCRGARNNGRMRNCDWDVLYE